MSLAPASSRGFFLNARLAVNGIQCAARSLGTLTLGALGLLSSMAGLFGFGWLDRGLPPTYQLRAAPGTLASRDISAQSGGSKRFQAKWIPVRVKKTRQNIILERSNQNALEIVSRNIKHLGFGILGVEPH